jgi:integrase
MSTKKTGATARAGVRWRKLDDGTRVYEARWRERSGRLRSKSGFRTAKEAADYRADQLDRLRRGTYVDPANARTPWSTLAERWLASKDEKLKERTRRSYRRILTTWLAKWDDKAVGDIDRELVRALFEAMRKKGLASQSRHNVFNVAHAIMTWAAKESYISVIPTLGMREELPARGESEDFEPRFLTAAEVDTIAEQLDARHGLLVRFTAWTGLRAAEVSGLKVKRLDPLRNQVHIVETAQWKDSEWIIEPPKSRKSRRTVPVPPELMREVVDFIAARNLRPDDYLFGGSEPHKHPAFYVGPWRRATKAAGFPGLRFHDLRHSFAALMDGLGYPVHRVSKWMGHSTTSFTMDRYMKHGLFAHEEEEHLTRLDEAYRNARSVSALPTGSD